MSVFISYNLLFLLMHNYIPMIEAQMRVNVHLFKDGQHPVQCCFHSGISKMASLKLVSRERLFLRLGLLH